MEENKEFMELMKKIESENAGQENYAKKQYQMTRISAVSSILVLVIVLVCASVLMPRIFRTFEQVDVVMADLETVSSELAETLPGMLANLDVMMGDLDVLVSSSSEGVAEAIEKMAALDIDSLNEAIRDLKAIVEPMARLFGR